MNRTTSRPTWAVVNLANMLSQLVDGHRSERDRANMWLRPRVAFSLDAAAMQLDAVRTRLVEDGEEFIDEATAFIDAGRINLAKTALYLDRNGRGHITIDCIDGTHPLCDTCDCICHA
jgi:hypothetical protein